MATIVNTPPNNDSTGSNLGMILGLLALAVLAYLFFAYGIPAIRGNSAANPNNINTTTPSVDNNNNGGSSGSGLNPTDTPAITGQEQNNTNIFNNGGSGVSPTDTPVPSPRSLPSGMTGSGTLSPVPSY